MIGKDLKRQMPGRAIPARTINRFADLVADLTRGQTLAGKGVGLDRVGRREEGFYAKLSGSTPPYSFVEVYGKMVGTALTWVTRPRGRTGTAAAYEDNATAGLSGKVAWIEPTETAGVWRFHFNRKTNYCNLSVVFRRPTSCPAIGATVTFTVGGILLYTGTTDSLGVVVFPYARTGVACVVAWDWFGVTGSTTITGCGPANIVLSPPLPAGYTVNCRDPMPDLFITDLAGTRQIYPLAARTCNSLAGWWYKTTLTANDGCGVVGSSPAWILLTGQYSSASDCANNVQFGNTSETINFSCTRPMSYSANYGLGPGLFPFLGGFAPPQPYMIHE